MQDEFAFSPIHTENLEMVISMPWQPLGYWNMTAHVCILTLIQLLDLLWWVMAWTTLVFLRNLICFRLKCVFFAEGWCLEAGWCSAQSESSTSRQRHPLAGAGAGESDAQHTAGFQSCIKYASSHKYLRGNSCLVVCRVARFAWENQPIGQFKICSVWPIKLFQILADITKL